MQFFDGIHPDIFELSNAGGFPSAFFNISKRFRRFAYLEVKPIAKKFQHEINGQIRDRELRVIGPDGKMLGVMVRREAQRLADEANLDLVKVSPNAKPPVCKILDYGKFRYEEMRRAKEAKKNQKTVIIKEVRMSVRVEEHDFAVKAKSCQKFLEQGNRVKVSVRFRGREMAYTDRGKKVLLDFADRVKDYGTIDKNPKLEGRNMSIFITPRKDINKDKARKPAPESKPEQEAAEA